MKDIKIYIITIIISTFMIIPSLFLEITPLINMLSSVGCSGLAAAIMAIFLERANEQRELRKSQAAKSLYFKKIYDQLIITIEKLLWFNDRLSDESFDWELQDSIYSSMNYMVAMNPQYKERKLSYDDAIIELSKMGEQYNLDNIKLLNEKDRHNVNRMFSIVAAGSIYLIMEANAIKDNKLILAVEDYMDIKENEQLMLDISFSIGLMKNNDKNYYVAIDSLIKATNKLREVGLYTNDIKVSLHGSISVEEL